MTDVVCRNNYKTDIDMKLKAFFRMLLCSVALFSFVACSSDDEDEFIIDPNGVTYVGDMSVDQNDGTSYIDKDLKISFTLDPAKQTATMFFYQAKFAERMPVRLDMTVSGITYQTGKSELSFTGHKIVPYAMGGPFEQYLITNLVGIVSNDSMMFTMVCGEFPVTFKGKIL